MKKTLFALGVATLAAFPLCAQETPPAPEAEPALAQAIPLDAVRLDNAQLDQLLGPIALYPDALIALILPASTVSADVVLSARYLRAGGEAAKIDEQPWDDSVRALAHYPDVVKWMDDNLAWTKQLGEAFVAQPADVMNSVQRLRLKARAVGSLTDTPQQNVVVENNTITIVPAQPEVIYVPAYDPDIVYVSRPTYYTQPFFSFGPAYATGFWLSYNLDWRRHRVWCVDRPHRESHWRSHSHHWHRPHSQRDFTKRPTYIRPWQPRPSFIASRGFVHTRGQRTIVRPRFHDGHVRRGTHDRGDSHFSRPRHTSGDRSSPAIGPALPAAAATTIPQLPLANPLPAALPSPLPEAPQPARVADRTRHLRPRGDAPRDHRADRAGSFGPRNRVVRAGPDSVTPAPTIASAPVANMPARPAFGGHRGSSHARPATPPAAAPSAPAPVHQSRAAPSTPAVTPSQPSRGSENRSFELPRDHQRIVPGVGGGRRGRGGVDH